MTFILATDGRDDDVSGAFARYKVYLEAAADRFPRHAYELAISDWYFNFNDHRCPHDAWVEELVLAESPVGGESRKRQVSLTLRLLGAYHDGMIELHYPTIYGYSMVNFAGHHANWQYDELRLSESGHLIHEIEWHGMHQTGRWLIEASDIELSWLSKQ